MEIWTVRAASNSWSGIKSSSLLWSNSSWFKSKMSSFQTRPLIWFFMLLVIRTQPQNVQVVFRFPPFCFVFVSFLKSKTKYLVFCCVTFSQSLAQLLVWKHNLTIYELFVSSVKWKNINHLCFSFAASKPSTSHFCMKHFLWELTQKLGIISPGLINLCKNDPTLHSETVCSSWTSLSHDVWVQNV